MKTAQRAATLTVLASLVVGACAGAVASVMTSSAIEDYATALLGDRGFTALEPRKPNANPLDYENAVRKVRDTQSRSLAVIAPKVADSQVPDRWMGAADGTGLGVVVSANGWILTADDQIENFVNPVTAAEVWVRGTRYAVSEVVRDDLTSFALLKLVDANGLTPIGFGASEDSENGDMVFVVSDSLGFMPTAISQSETLILSGPQPAEKYATAWALGIDEVGPVLSTSGDLLAFATAEDLVTPIHHGSAFVQDTLRNGEVAHAALGAYVVYLSDVYNLDPDLRRGLNAGALVIAPTGRLAMPANSPAAIGGLQLHDIITSIEGEAINPTTSISEILATYDPGQTARINVVRDDAPIEITVIFGDASALVY